MQRAFLHNRILSDGWRTKGLAGVTPSRTPNRLVLTLKVLEDAT